MNILTRGYIRTCNTAWRIARRLHREDEGAGAAEYAMVIGIAVVFGLGILRKFWGENDDSGLRKVFVQIVTRLQDIFIEE